MAVRAVVARAAGGAMAPFRSGGGGGVAGVIAVVGGEGVAQPDPARLIALAVDPITGQYGLGLCAAAPDREAAALPWFGPVCAVALAPPPGRPETAAAAVVLSEGGQIHVHDIRALFAPAPAAVPPPLDDAAAGSEVVEEEGWEDGGIGQLPPAAPAAAAAVAPLPVAEVLAPLPPLDTSCAPAVAAARADLAFDFDSGAGGAVEHINCHLFVQLGPFCPT